MMSQTRISSTLFITLIIALWSSTFNVIFYDPLVQTSSDFEFQLSEDYKSSPNVGNGNKSNSIARGRKSNGEHHFQQKERSTQEGGKQLEESSTKSASTSTSSSTQEIETINNNDNSDNDDRNIFVMHVGPHKTASSDLQTFILNTTIFTDSLKKDNYQLPRFVGGKFSDNHAKNHAVLVHCFLIHNMFCPAELKDSLLNQFTSFLHDAANDKSNVLFTSEALDFPSFDIKEFTNYLVPHFKIHVVVYYRRFYDWIFSTYNQQTKRKALSGKVFPTFQEWLQLKMIGTQNKYSYALRDRFKTAPGVFNVSVVNLHQKGAGSDFVEQFFCDHVDQAPHSCNAARSIENGKVNSSKDLDWLTLRSRVQKHHSINLELEDKRWLKIEKKFKGMKDAPQTCLPDDLKNELLRQSIEFETAMTPEWWHNSKDGLEDLKNGFEKTVNSKFCFVDVNKVLKSTDWQRFLTKLEKKS